MKDLDPEICFRAFLAKDARFDGSFFVGVATTGIYCRTVCRAKKPKRQNCRFFLNAAQAQQAGFRPCKLCRPEQAPGFPTSDIGSTLVACAVNQIELDMLSNPSSIQQLANTMGVGSRQLRRVFHEKLGINPIQFVQAKRLLMAKRLLSETSLSMVQVAMVSGFQSLRRFNDLFKSSYGEPPSQFRNRSSEGGKIRQTPDSIRLTLGYRPPFAWTELLQYLQRRAIPGVESVTANHFARTLSLGGRTGWIRVSNLAECHSIQIEIASELVDVVPLVIARVRRLFDLDASPLEIAEQLSKDRFLAESVGRCPGLRLPGAMHSFETAVRTILGQQVSVAAATTVMSRIVNAFGEAITTPFSDLSRLTIIPERIAVESIDTLASLGINSARANAILSLAQAIVAKQINLEFTLSPQKTIDQIQELPGIGPWTANYFGMRILGSPDAFVASDLVVRKQLAPHTPKQIEELSQAWRPWRAYAVMHLWNSAGFFQSKGSKSV